MQNNEITLDESEVITKVLKVKKEIRNKKKKESEREQPGRDLMLLTWNLEERP